MKRTFIVLFICLVANAYGARFLFDADHGESAGNADWVIDADLHNLTWNSSGTFTVNTGGNESNPQRVPTPPAGNIASNTSETYWQGAISAWAIDLVKRGHSVETLPAGTTLTYNTANSQDLTNYDVVVIDEPNILFALSEKQALLSFVSNGGSLFMISDHVTSDRNGDGHDSVDIWNDFLTNNLVTNNPFGIIFRSTGTGSNSSGSNTFSHVITGDPILNGPAGVATNMQYFNGNEFQIDNTKNPTVISRMWFGLAGDSNNFCGLASLQYGSGRVVVCGDSSCIDDGTGDPNDSSLFDGYMTDAGGVQHIWILNASEWLAATAVFPSAYLGVSPSNDFNSFGVTGGPFNPTSASYILNNTGTNMLTWTASNTSAWNNLSQTNGILPAGSSVTVNLTLTAAANLLSAGSYTDSVTFVNATNGIGTTVRNAVLNVFASTGFFDDAEGGTNNWSPSSLWHIVGTTACSNWYSATHSWYFGRDINCSFDNFDFPTGVLKTPSFIVPTNALLLYFSWEEITDGQDICNVLITTNDWVTSALISSNSTTHKAWHGVTNNLSSFAGKAARLGFQMITMTENGLGLRGWYIDDIRVSGPLTLVVTPSLGVNIAGDQGGPFSPAMQTYTLSNPGSVSMSWSASVSNNWVGLSAVSGNLAAGANTNLTVSTNANTSALVGGLYSNLVSFVNFTNGSGSTNLVWTLLVRDGIPDAWRLQYFGHVDPLASDLSRASDDSDGDGFTNLQEFQAGTDPTNSASFFGITSITQVSTNILITWMTGPGKTNALERTAGAAGSFINNFAAIFTVTNTVAGTTNYLDIGAATNVPAFYYRVRLVP